MKIIKTIYKHKGVVVNALIGMMILFIPMFTVYRSYVYLKNSYAQNVILKTIGFTILSFFGIVFGSMLLEDIPALLILFYIGVIFLIYAKTKELNKQELESRKKTKEERSRLKKEKIEKSKKEKLSDDDFSDFKVSVSTTYESDDKDSFEGWFYEDVYDYIDCKKTFKLKYKDAKGKVTNRTIDMYRLGEISEGFFILAYCRLRNENRTFRTDRMLECIDMETGECISDIKQYFSDLYYNSEQYKEIKEWREKQEEKAIQEEYYEEFMQKYAVLLKVLMYIVRCDGTFNQREKAIVREIFENLENNNELMTDKMLNRIYKNVDMPSYKSFQHSVSKLLNDKSIGIDLLQITKNIIATQKNIHENEEQVLKYLENKLAK